VNAKRRNLTTHRPREKQKRSAPSPLLALPLASCCLDRIFPPSLPPSIHPSDRSNGRSKVHRYVVVLMKPSANLAYRPTDFKAGCPLPFFLFTSFFTPLCLTSFLIRSPARPARLCCIRFCTLPACLDFLSCFSPGFLILFHFACLHDPLSCLSACLSVVSICLEVACFWKEME